MTTTERFFRLTTWGLLLSFSLIPPGSAMALRNMAADSEGVQAGLEQALRGPAAGQAAGLEATRKAARILETYLPNFQGGTDVERVRAFLNHLRQPSPPIETFPGDLLSVATYQAGPFAREDLSDEAASEYLQDQWISGARGVLEGVARQLEVAGQRVALEDLGFPILEELLTHLYFARDDSNALLIGPDQQMHLYRWIYREIPRILVPEIADARVARSSLRRALENPFRLSNDEGTDTMKRAIDRLLKGQPGRFRDDPGMLRADPEEWLTPWIKLMLASNLVDYAHRDILDEIRREGDLAQYVIHRMDTPFLVELGGERYIRVYLKRLAQPNTVKLHLPDNNAQLAASLKLAEVELSAFPTLTIYMVVKGDSGAMNDASYRDAQRAMEGRKEVPDIYARLRGYQDQKRFVLVHGPKAAGMPLDLLPSSAVEAFRAAHVVLAEGEANTWAMNGLNKEVYLALRLKWRTGLSRLFGIEPTEEILRQKPPAFIRIDGSRGPYYWNAYEHPGKGAHLTVAQFLAAQQAGLEGEEDEEEPWIIRFPTSAPRRVGQPPAGDPLQALRDAWKRLTQRIDHKKVALLDSKGWVTEAVPSQLDLAAELGVAYSEVARHLREIREFTKRSVYLLIRDEVWKGEEGFLWKREERFLQKAIDSYNHFRKKGLFYNGPSRISYSADELEQAYGAVTQAFSAKPQGSESALLELAYSMMREGDVTPEEFRERVKELNTLLGFLGYPRLPAPFDFRFTPRAGLEQVAAGAFSIERVSLDALKDRYGDADIPVDARAAWLAPALQVADWIRFYVGHDTIEPALARWLERQRAGLPKGLEVNLLRLPAAPEELEAPGLVFKDWLLRLPYAQNLLPEFEVALGQELPKLPTMILFALKGAAGKVEAVIGLMRLEDAQGRIVYAYFV